VSTRLIGAMIMVHGDDHGLRVPPRLAPTQVIVLVAREGEGVIDAANTLVGDLRRRGARIALDDRLEISLGRRIIDHELRGVPVRVELGPRELAAGQAVVVRRARSSKETIALPEPEEELPRMLEDDQQDLLLQATTLRDQLTQRAETVEEAKEIARTGFARIPWQACGPEGEDEIAASGMSLRCLWREDGLSADRPDDADVEALIARAD
jgi:prolyl-tRNA synthetase